VKERTPRTPNTLEIVAAEWYNRLRIRWLCFKYYWRKGTSKDSNSKPDIRLMKDFPDWFLCDIRSTSIVNDDFRAEFDDIITDAIHEERARRDGADRADTATPDWTVDWTVSTFQVNLFPTV